MRGGGDLQAREGICDAGKPIRRSTGFCLGNTCLRWYGTVVAAGSVEAMEQAKWLSELRKLKLPCVYNLGANLGAKTSYMTRAKRESSSCMHWILQPTDSMRVAAVRASLFETPYPRPFRKALISSAACHESRPACCSSSRKLDKSDAVKLPGFICNVGLDPAGESPAPIGIDVLLRRLHSLLVVRVALCQ